MKNQISNIFKFLSFFIKLKNAFYNDINIDLKKVLITKMNNNITQFLIIISIKKINNNIIQFSIK